MSASLKAALRTRSEELGLLRMGVARAEPLSAEGDHLRAWLAAQRHGEMTWMERTADVRVDPGHPGMVPGAMSVVVFATPFARAEPDSVRIGDGRIARYAWGRDYHNVLTRRMRKLERLLRDEGHEARASVDSRPVFERAWAVRAGVGFVGKNCCLIVPGLGSHLFLSCLVTTAELPADEPIREGCGRCTACLDVCPTRAFVGPRQLDARACISYLTIELEGPVPEEHRAGMGDWLFGCDACQDVCPYNRTKPPPSASTEPFAPHARFVDPAQAWPLDALFTTNDEVFADWAEGSPLRRSGRGRLARNAALVMGNSGDRRHLPVLQRAASRDASPVVREAAAWGVSRLSEASESPAEPGRAGLSPTQPSSSSSDAGGRTRS